MIVLASEPVSGDLLREAVGPEAENAEVLVVSPALQDSRLKFWASDADQAIERAEQVQEESVERLDEEGIDAAGDTGESDPLLALQDALATFDADRVVIFSHPEGDSAYLEDEQIEEAQRRLGVPVERRLITR